MDDKWYAITEGEVKGPLTSDNLYAMSVSGKLKPGDLVRKEGTEEWIPAGRVPGLKTEIRTRGKFPVTKEKKLLAAIVIVTLIIIAAAGMAATFFLIRQNSP